MNDNAIIDTMRDCARNERDLARAALVHAESVAEHAQMQAQQLLLYRDEYVQRWNNQFRSGSAITLVQCYQTFMQKLDQAIAHQQRATRDAADRAEAARTQLRQCELQLASVGKLIDRRQRARTQVAARREQRASDEAAQRTALHGTPRLASSV
jgi:flagellar FliJ protein